MGLDQNLMRRKADGEVVSEIYWRKANFVHRFFTEDWVERGFESDNCTEFPVSEDDLQFLTKLCVQVLEDREDPEYTLPTMSGFFFGSTDYDEWYYEDVSYTMKEIAKLMTERPLQEGEELFYTAWY